MFKLLIILMLFYNVMYADEKATATKIVKTIVNVLASQATVWVDENDSDIAVFMKLNAFKIAQKCEDADVVILKEKSSLPVACKKKPLVVLDYDLFDSYDNAVAAFFWKKGRPNIVFIKDRMKNFAIKLPVEYAIYEEETIW